LDDTTETKAKIKVLHNVTIRGIPADAPEKMASVYGAANRARFACFLAEDARK
jgi:hypothetical protein